MSTETMTSRERLIAARLCHPVDRVPIRVWGADPWTQVWHSSFQPILEAALEHTDIVAGWKHRVGHFFSAAPELTPRTVEKPSSHEGYVEQILIYQAGRRELTQIKLVSPDNKPEMVVKFMVEAEEDARAWLAAPYVPHRPDVSLFSARDRELGQRGIVSTGIGREPVHLLHELMGSETLALWSLEKRDLLREMLSVAQARAIDYVTYLLDQGVGPHFGYVGPEVCIPPLMNPRDFREFVVEIDRPILRLIREAGGIVWVHCHGGMNPVLEGFVEMGVHCLNPMEPPPMGDLTLAEARARVGDALCLEGNIEVGDLIEGTPGEIETLVARAIGEARGGGFVLCPTSGFMEWPTASPRLVENFLAFIRAGRALGHDFG